MISDLTEFLKLSAVLSYQLYASDDNRSNILILILGEKRPTNKQKAILLDVLNYLNHAYGTRRRRLGPLAVLHPLRATALLARSMPELRLLDVLTELLHDKLEDIKPDKLINEKDPEACYAELEKEFASLLSRIDPDDKWYLMERIDWLTRKDQGETYYNYIGRILEQSQKTPELVRVKLADRLDNTLDMHVDIQDSLDHENFYEIVFRILFVKNQQALPCDEPHYSSKAINGATRLYQLFKNAITLSLIRQKKPITDEPVAELLFREVAYASMKEAQRIVLHIFRYHYQDIAKQRELILDTLDYCRNNGIERITPHEHGHRLDGLFKTCFEFIRPEDRKAKLEALYANKVIMIEGALAFIVIFQSFLYNSNFFIHGISKDGICTENNQPDTVNAINAVDT